MIQKSTREGFGLTVSEALWKGRPFIGGDVGGIPLQVADRRVGYLVGSVEDARRARWISSTTQRSARRSAGAAKSTCAPIS